MQIKIKQASGLYNFKVKVSLKENTDIGDFLKQGWANFSVQGPHSKFHNFIGPHSILIKITDI